MSSMQAETLQQLVFGRVAELARQRKLKLSVEQLARLSSGALSEDTVKAIAAGDAVQLTEDQASGLAAALEAPTERVVLDTMYTAR